MSAMHPTERLPIDGPDYLALVIEWDDIADSLEDGLDQTALVSRPSQSIARSRHEARAAVGTAVTLVGVLALAAWGIHRLVTA
ncbi:MAG TPA: hypothetical protein VGC42_28000 [Kofleriaceae bacterium]